MRIKAARIAAAQAAASQANNQTPMEIQTDSGQLSPASRSQIQLPHYYNSQGGTTNKAANKQAAQNVYPESGSPSNSKLSTYGALAKQTAMKGNQQGIKVVKAQPGLQSQQ